jgi:hypothetical protein
MGQIDRIERFIAPSRMEVISLGPECVTLGVDLNKVIVLIVIDSNEPTGDIAAIRRDLDTSALGMIAIELNPVDRRRLGEDWLNHEECEQNCRDHGCGH